MLPVLSTHLFLRQRLHPGILETAARSGAQGVELFAARQHFDYTSMCPSLLPGSHPIRCNRGQCMRRSGRTAKWGEPALRL